MNIIKLVNPESMLGYTRHQGNLYKIISLQNHHVEGRYRHVPRTHRRGGHGGVRVRTKVPE